MRRMTIPTLLTLLALAALAGGQELSVGSDAAITYSLFSNSGFEQGLEGWSVGRGWGAMDDALRDSALEIRTDGAKQGQRYLRVTNRDPENRFYGIQQDVRWEPNTVYTISFWTRGKGRSGHERGANRLRMWGYGGPEYGGDVPYDTPEWTYHEHVLYSAGGGSGGVALWTWPANSETGYCDIDGFVIRKAFWRSDTDAAEPGKPVTFSFDMQGRQPEAVQVEYTIASSGGQAIAQESFEGSTPLQREVRFVPPQVGYYVFRGTARTAGGELSDTLGLAVVSPVRGMDAVRRQWEQNH